MKPWPSAILERYPLDPARCHAPTRPWWCSIRQGDYSRLWRAPILRVDPIDRPGVIDVEWRRVAVPAHAYVHYPINAQGQTFNVVYAPDGGTSSISTFPGAVADFGENYDATMPMETEADVLALLERIDRERPIPHPGFRVGQLWSEDDGNTVQIAAVQIAAIDDRRVVWAMSHGTFSFPANRYNYLVADPACPFLAPWSPA